MKRSILWYLCFKYAYFFTCTLILTGTLQIHGVCFHSYTLHFLSYHTVGQKLVAMTYRGSKYMYVCMYMSAHACLHVHTSHVPSLCLDRFWISFCLQLYIPNLQHGTVHWLSSWALQYFNSAVLGMSCLHLLSYVDSLTHLTQTDFMLNAQLCLKPKLLLHTEQSNSGSHGR